MALWEGIAPSLEPSRKVF